MCLQCVVDAESITQIFGDDAPLFLMKARFGDDTPLFLMKARKDDPDWKAGQWGLVICNDPEVVWDGPTPWPDPSFGVSDEVQKGWNAEQNALAAKWMKDARNFADAFRDQGHIYAGYRVGNACRVAGWDQVGLFTHFLYHKMGEACLNPVNYMYPGPTDLGLLSPGPA